MDLAKYSQLSFEIISPHSLSTLQRCDSTDARDLLKHRLIEPVEIDKDVEICESRYRAIMTGGCRKQENYCLRVTPESGGHSIKGADDGRINHWR